MKGQDSKRNDAIVKELFKEALLRVASQSGRNIESFSSRELKAIALVTWFDFILSQTGQIDSEEFLSFGTEEGSDVHKLVLSLEREGSKNPTYAEKY